MAGYNYSYFNNVTTNAPNVNFGVQNTSVEQNGITNSPAQVTELGSVTPDYGVSVPVGYTKTGVEKLSNGQEIHCYKLNNGQKVYIAPKESAETIVNTYVNTGSLNEKDDERGISHFCEHMAFNGTKGTNGYYKLGTGDTFRTIEHMGGYLNASTNYAETNYTLQVPSYDKSYFETAVKMQAAMMNNLEMSPEMTEKEHGPVTSEISMYADMPFNIASNVAVKNLYNIKTTSDDIVAGTVDNILNVDSKKVTDYYKNNYFPANMTTVITGDVNPDEAIELVAKNFRGENPQNPDRRLEPLAPTDKMVRQDIISPKAVATTGVLCFNGPANNDTKGNIAIEALNHLLFNKKNSVSEKALDPYHVEVRATKDKLRSETTDGTLLALTYDATEENSEIALKSIFNTLYNFKAPTPEEMEVLKTGLKMKYEKTYEDTEGLNYLIGQNALNGNLGECTDAIKVIDSLTAQDLVDAVHKYYDVNKVSIAVIHPESATEESLKTNYSNASAVSFKGLNTQSNVTADKLPMNTQAVERYTLPNNCEVALINSNNDIATFVAKMSGNVPAYVKPGVAEVLAEMIKKGDNSIIDLVDRANITAYSGATNSNVYYEAELPAQNLSTALGVMKKSVFNPNFTPENLEKIKGQIKSELMTAQPNAFDNMKNELFPNNPKGYSNKDILNNIDNVTLEDVTGLHKYIMDNGGFTFALSAPISKYPNIRNVVNSELSAINNSKPVSPQTFNDYVPIEKSKVVTDVANTEQAEVLQAYKYPLSKDPKEFIANRLMAAILSNGDDTGLFNNLREKEKLAYSVEATTDYDSSNSALLVCAIKTTTDGQGQKTYDNVQRSINGFTRQLGKMASGDFTDKEFESAKLRLKQHYRISCDNAASRVTNLSGGMNSVNGYDELNKYYAAIDTLTKEDIQAAAQRVITTKPLYSVKASKDTLSANQGYFIGLENN